ncbi:DUF3310 domain-containing protein [Salipaludibacillus sp. HK11]|uniref:DUF3310 domain-containing protein n=1 Tax=Salipaludibacillus sp. HK11 TaxID=3394320 RepID=UPI0039FBCE17
MKEALGKVKDKRTGVELDYINKDENGFEVVMWHGINGKAEKTQWVSNSNWQEIDKPDPLTINDPIKPNHYHSGGIDVFTYLEANLSKEAVIGYHQGSAIKYIIRAGKKGSDSEDFKKAAAHVDNLVRLSE